LNTKQIKEKYNLAPEWKVLTELASGLGISNLNQEKANLDLSLNKKLLWFLLGGAAGVLYLIKDNYGQTGLNQFYQFINQYLNRPNQIGSIRLSDTLNRSSQFVKTESARQDFSRILSNLQEELREKDLRKEK
jgi:hypothetical protein